MMPAVASNGSSPSSGTCASTQVSSEVRTPKDLASSCSWRQSGCGGTEGPPQTNKNGKWGNKHESVNKLSLFVCTWAVFAVRDLRTLSRIAPFHLRPRWENDIPFNHVASFFFLQVVAGDAVRKQCSLDATLNLKNREISQASFVPINHPPGKQKHHQGCVSFGRLCAAVLLCYPRAVPVHVCRGVVGAAALGFNESLTGDHCAQKVDYG